MIEVDYDDTTNLTLFIHFFHFFDCSNEMSITSVTRYFDSVKSILKQMECRIRMSKIAKNYKRWALTPCVIYMNNFGSLIKSGMIRRLINWLHK